MDVLIADGSPITGPRVESSLAAIPGVCVCARVLDVDAADAMVAEQHPDVLVLDAGLPGGGALDLLGRMDRDPSRPMPVTIVLASPASLAYRLRFHRAGAAFFLDKVREMDRLVETILELGRELAGRLR